MHAHLYNCTQTLYSPGLPSSTPSSTSDLDVSLMYSIFRNAIVMPSPSKGWGNFPDASNQNISDDIERIRHYRNKISHENSAEMTTEEFNTSVLELISVSILYIIIYIIILFDKKINRS